MKCPNCDKFLEELKGKHKIAVQISGKEKEGMGDIPEPKGLKEMMK